MPSKDTKVGRFARSFARTAGARAALAPSMLAPINLDARLAAATVIRALPRIERLRSSILQLLPAFDLRHLDELEVYGEALSYAQLLYVKAAEPARPLAVVLGRGAQVRGQLLADASALARRGLIDPAFVSDLRVGTGYVNIASDIGVLVRTLRGRWRHIKGKSAIELRELDEAEELRLEIERTHAQRLNAPAKITRAADDRARAFTLMVNAYDEVRRALSYLRWHEGDADDFAPSLWSKRRATQTASHDTTRSNSQQAKAPRKVR